MSDAIIIAKEYVASRQRKDVDSYSSRVTLALDNVFKQAARYEFICKLPTMELVELRRQSAASKVRFSVLLDELMEEGKNE